jgi:cyclopropane fatty-acyl-phospholipid synthase-like methyltransferase
VNFQEVLTRHVDVIWIGLSLHHLTTQGKADFMEKAKDVLKNDGLFLIYEPASMDGEDRIGYVRRFEQTNKKLWTALTPDEWSSVMKHVNESDIPESASSWIRLGQEAGFVDCRELFRDMTGLYSLFLYQRDH